MRTEGEIRDWLVSAIARTSRLPAGQIDPARTFDTFGLNSLQAVTLSGDLEEWYGQELSPTLFWDYPTIDRLVAYLVGYDPARDDEQ